MERYGKSLFIMAEQVYEWCKTKGWEPDPDRKFGEECALIHSEVSEALEAWRTWKFDDATSRSRFELTDPNRVEPKPEGVGSEFADILIRLLHYSYVHNIDLEYEFDRKMRYNETRTWRHGNRNC